MHNKNNNNNLERRTKSKRRMNGEKETLLEFVRNSFCAPNPQGSNQLWPTVFYFRKLISAQEKKKTNKTKKH